MNTKNENSQNNGFNEQNNDKTNECTFRKHIKDAYYCANSGGVGDTVTVVSGGVEYHGSNKASSRISSDPRSCAVSGSAIDGNAGRGGAIGCGSSRNEKQNEAQGSGVRFSDSVWSKQDVAHGGAPNGSSSNTHTEQSDTVGKTQEKVDMKVRSRADVNKLYGGTDKDGEQSDPPSVTLRGGFISDGDVFGTGRDRPGRGRPAAAKATGRDGDTGRGIDDVSANKGAANNEVGKDSIHSNSEGENALGNTDFDSYGDFGTACSSAEWHGALNSDESSEDENEEKEQTIAPENRKKDPKNDKTVVTGEGERKIKTIVIAGQIEGHSQLPQGQKATRYEELIPELVEIEESESIGGLLLILNTVGGDVEAGLALSELIAGMKKPTASLVLGGGHSIGVPLAVSAKRSFIVPSATMTLHPVRITGMILGAPQTYVYLNKMQERIIDFTCSHCEMSAERFNELMLGRDEMSTDLGSVLDGRQAVDEGLIDALGTLNDAITFLKDAMS